MSADGSCQGDDGLDAAVGGPEEPFVEILLGFFRRLEIKILKGEAELIGFGRFEVASGEIKGGEGDLLIGRQIVGIFQPDVAAASQFGVVLQFEPANFVYRFID